MSFREIGLVLLVILVWGLNFVAVRLGLAGMPPMLMVAFRFLFSALPVVFLLPRPAIPARYLFGYAMLVGVGQYTLFYSALKLGMPAGLSSILMQLQAFATVIISALFLKERVHSTQVFGLLIAVTGLYLVGATLDGSVGVLPLLMILAAAISWGAGNVVTRAANNWAIGHAIRLDMLAFTAWGCLIPIVPMFVVAAAVEGPAAIAAALARVDLTVLLASLYTAYLSTVFAYAIWNRLIGKHGASQIAPFSLLVPIIGVISTAVALGERVPAQALAAGGLIMLGLALNVWGRKVASAFGAWWQPAT